MKFNWKEFKKLWLKASTGQKEGKMTHKNCVAIDQFIHGFEAELREILQGNKPYGPSPMVKELIKEILCE